MTAVTADSLAAREVRELRKEIRAQAIRQDLLVPRPVDFYATGVFPASGNLLLIPGQSGPSSGYTWHVRFLAFTGTSAATTSPAGAGFVFVGPASMAAASDLSGAYVDRTTTPFPVSGFYSDFELVVTYPEAIYAVVTTGTAATSYTFRGTAKQVVDTAEGVETYSLG